MKHKWSIGHNLNLEFTELDFGAAESYVFKVYVSNVLVSKTFTVEI